MHARPVASRCMLDLEPRQFQVHACRQHENGSCVHAGMFPAGNSCQLSTALTSGFKIPGSCMPRA
eukprot:351309-Chlamydomonas_euryale.AAC.2